MEVEFFLPRSLYVTTEKRDWIHIQEETLMKKTITIICTTWELSENGEVGIFENHAGFRNFMSFILIILFQKSREQK